jgi:hypothetical protein
MQALQHQYTSCRKGQSGNAGFQTRASTEGLRPDEQREIERRGIYTQPRNAKQDPTHEEILQDFPRAFRYYTMESGRWALTYSCYAGQDYSGRWGNYFAHTIIGDHDLPPIWPIDYYEWEGWKTRLSADEDTEDAPSPLPDVDITGIKPAESFTFEELKEFLREVPSRRAFLADMLRAVFMHQETSRALVIRDSFLNGLFWTACIQKALPFACLRELSFSTYQFDDRNCAAINTTTEGTNFQFDEAQRKYQFFMFDFTNIQYSEVAKADMDYSDIVTGWMATNPEQLKKFHDFLGSFTFQTLAPELTWVARLFQSSVGEGQSLTGEELRAIIDLASRFTAPQGQDKVVDMMIKLTPMLRETANSDDYERLIRFFARAAQTSGKPKHRYVAFSSWISMFDELSFRRGIDFDRVNSMRDEFMQLFVGYEQELAQIFLSDHHMTGIREAIPTLRPEVLEEILKEVMTSLYALRRSPAWEQPDAKRIITAILNSPEEPRRSAYRVFNVLAGDANALAAVCQIVAADGRAKSLPQKHANRCIAVGTAVRRQLDKNDTWNLLYGEWLESLDRNTDKQETYNQYIEYAAKHLSKYVKVYRPHLAESLIRKLPEDQQSMQAMAWVLNKELHYFPQDFAQECVKLANLDVSFDSKAPNAKKKAIELTGAANNFGVDLKPDRPFLFDVILRTEGIGTRIEELPLSDLQKAMTVIDPPGYTVFLANFLKTALGKAKVGYEHKMILSAIFNNKYLDRFMFSYSEYIDQPQKDLFSGSDEATLVFWLADMWREKRLMALGSYKDQMLEILAQRVAALNEDQYFKLNEHMWRRSDELRRDGLEIWKQIGKERETRQRSFLRGWLSRKKS